MRILKVIDFFYPAEEAGGPVPVAYNFAKRLVERGHHVTIWTSNLLTATTRMSKKTFTDTKDGIRVVYLNSPLRYRWTAITPSLFSFCRRELRSFDIIHFYAYRGFMPLVVARYAKKYGVPYVLQSLGTVPILVRSRVKKYLYDRAVGHRTLRNAQMLIAKSHLEKKHYLDVRIPEEKIALIPNGIDLSEPPADLKRGEFRRRFNLNDDDKIVLFLARIHKRKGLDLLVKAFSDLEIEDARLVITGPDDGFLKDTRALVDRHEITDRVIFTGPLYGRDKFQVYMDSDVYVLPAIQEIFAVSVLEALLFRLPVIITEDFGIAPLIKDKVGLTIPYEAEALTRAMERLLTDEELTESFKSKSSTLLKRHFTWDTHVDSLENLYGSVLNADSGLFNVKDRGVDPSTSKSSLNSPLIGSRRNRERNQ